MGSSALTQFMARVRVCTSSTVADQGDGPLLQRFLDHHDEKAFEELVRRHGPMVLAVCRRRLGHEHDAEEAFQATFLLLACKGTLVEPRQQVGAWLHGVAYRVASQAARSARRRQFHEQRARPLAQQATLSEEHELRELIDGEVAHLPERYRAPLVLCLLEGRTPREVAHILGWPEGSVSGRLTRAKRLLADRLSRRGYGIDCSMPLALPVLSAEQLASTTLTAAARLAGPEGLVSVRVVTLMQEVVSNMWRSMMQKLLAVTLSVALVGTGIVFGLAQGSDERPVPAERPDPEPLLQLEPKLPSTMPPTQVLVRISKDEVYVSWEVVSYQVVQEKMADGSLRTFYNPVKNTTRRTAPLADVKIQTARGKKLAKEEAVALFKKDRVAVASFDGTPVDPLHLRILKGDTPVIVLPQIPVPPPAVAPTPAVGFPIAPPRAAPAVPAMAPQPLPAPVLPPAPGPVPARP